jgi:hypothetical protein
MPVLTANPLLSPNQYRYQYQFYRLKFSHWTGTDTDTDTDTDTVLTLASILATLSPTSVVSTETLLMKLDSPSLEGVDLDYINIY